MKTLIATAIAATVIASSLASAQAATMRKAPEASPASFRTIIATQSKGSQAQENKAKAWTSACYAEFGPKAKYPDAALLEKCLNW